MSDPIAEMKARVEYAHDALLADGKLVASEVGASVAVSSMVYAAMEIAGEAKLCPHCIQRLLIDVLSQLNGIVEHGTRRNDGA